MSFLTRMNLTDLQMTLYLNATQSIRIKQAPLCANNRIDCVQLRSRKLVSFLCIMLREINSRSADLNTILIR